MPYTNLTVRVNVEDKQLFQAFCDDVGLNVSATINLFVKKVIKDGKIPFEIESDPFYSKSNMDWIRKSIDSFEKGKVIEKTIEEIEAM